jgi:hypothetical protein
LPNAPEKRSRYCKCFTHAKFQLQSLRDSNWDDFFESLVSFFEQHDIEIPDIIAPYKVGTGRSY